MKRALVVGIGACLLLSFGCRDYDVRLEDTLQEMKYQKRLNDNLAEAPTKGLLQQELIYIRPPKGFTGPTKAFSLVTIEPGKFDLENSFIEEAKTASLHVLARHKKPKAAAPKKGPAPAEPPPRGDFTAEVIEVLKLAYGVDDLEPAKFRPETKSHKGRENSYKFTKLDLATKEVQIYLYGPDKNSPYNVALIFEYPKTEVNSLSPKIGLSLEAFAVGEAARRIFAGGSEAEGGEEATDSGQPVPI
jgi:hypothetical protein